MEIHVYCKTTYSSFKEAKEQNDYTTIPLLGNYSKHSVELGDVARAIKAFAKPKNVAVIVEKSVPEVKSKFIVKDNYDLGA